jgi:DNA polymerase I-like protein with 3'-5' exonuclease and polymerase domains
MIQDASPENPTCQKCGAFNKCANPFIQGFSFFEGGGVLSMIPETEPKDGFIVVVGNYPSEKADVGGTLWNKRDELYVLYKIFKEYDMEHRLFYLPGFRCRPNALNKETMEFEPEKLGKAELKRCFNHMVEPYIKRLSNVSAIIALGPIGTNAMIGRLDYWNLVGRAYRYGENEIPVYAAWHRDHIRTNPDRLGMEWFKQLELITQKIKTESFAKQEHIDKNYVLAMRPEQIREWFEPVYESTWPVSWDTETRGLEKFRAGFKVGVFSFDHPTRELPLIVVTDFKDAPDMFARECPDLVREGVTWAEQRKLLEAELRIVLEDEEILKIGHNLQFDENSVFAYYGWEVKGFVGDTIMWQWALNPDEAGFLGLESLVRLYFPDIPEYWRELDKWKEENMELLGNEVNDYTSIPEKIILPYAAYDTKVVTRLFKEVHKRVKELDSGSFIKRSDDQEESDWTDSVTDTYKLKDYLLHVRKLHHELCAEMERIGQCIDHDLVDRVHSLYSKEVASLEEALSHDEELQAFERGSLHKVISKSSDQAKALRRGEEIRMNWGSTVQQRAFFINHLKLPILKKTDKGAPCLDERVVGDYAASEWILKEDGTKVLRNQGDVLEEGQVIWHCEVARKLLSWRKADKFIKSFLLPIVEKRVIHDDGLMHAQYRSNGIATGRLGCKAPNVQAIPRDGLIKKLYRSHHKDGWIITRDYSGIEVRILALFCRDPLLLKTFKEGGDVHFLTQSHFFGKDADKKNKTQRSICKQALFGNIYGQGDQGLFDLLTENRVINPKTGEPVTLDECGEFNEMIYSLYPHVGKWVEDSHRFGEEFKWIASAFGFVRQLPEFQDIDYYKTILKTKTSKERRKDPYARVLGAKISQARRRAQNTSIQSTAADFTVIAAHRINTEYKKRKLGSRVFNVIHDDIWTSVKSKDEVVETMAIKAWYMDNAKEWLPEYLPKYDASWIQIPIIGEADVGLNPRDCFSVTSEPELFGSNSDMLVKFGEENGSPVYKDFTRDYEEIYETLSLKRLVVS